MFRLTVQYATCLSLYFITIFVLHLARREQGQIAFLCAVTACPTQLSATADVLLFKPQQSVRKDGYRCCYQIHTV